MGSPIDPVTGLPMVGVPDVVSQIPLGVQVVPWDDIKAVDRPQGGPSYPNDIINTFAYMTGENIAQPGTAHTGTFTEDRRLRVDTGSSGGSSLWAQALPENASRLVLGPLDEDASRFGFRKLFFGLLASVSIFDFGTISGTANVWTETINFDLNNLINIADLSLGGFYDGNMIHGTYTAHCEVLLPAPIDLSLVPPGLFGETSIHTNNQTNFTVLVYHAPIFDNQS